MRYFPLSVLLGVATIFIAIRAGAQQPANPTSPGVLPDFASSANARVNYYRAMAKLPPVVNDTAISAGAYNHARYLVKNGIAGGDIVIDQGQLQIKPPQDAFRWEVKGKPFYTDEGASAGRGAVVIAAREINISGAEFVDRMMTMPFGGLDSDGAAIFGGRTRRVLRPGPVRNRDRGSLRVGEVGAARALRRPPERSTLESEPRTHSDGDRPVAIAGRISARWRHR